MIHNDFRTAGGIEEKCQKCYCKNLNGLKDVSGKLLKSHKNFR